MKIDINKIKENKRNPRKINEDMFEKLVASLKEFPEMLEARPLIIDKDYVVIGGNMRLKALNKVGLKEIPVMIVDWSEEQKRQFVVKDNLSYGVWDYEMIGADYGIDELEHWGLSLGDLGEEPEDLTQDLKDNKPQINITFLSIEDLENAKEEISPILDRYEGSFYSIKGGEV
jgi:ParB-like chromosome segregation protein Spo0J